MAKTASSNVRQGMFRLWVVISISWSVISFIPHLGDVLHIALLRFGSEQATQQETRYRGREDHDQIMRYPDVHQHPRYSVEQMSRMRTSLKDKGVIISGLTNTAMPREFAKQASEELLFRTAYLLILKIAVPMLALLALGHGAFWVAQGFRSKNGDAGPRL